MVKIPYVMRRKYLYSTLLTILHCAFLIQAMQEMGLNLKYLQQHEKRVNSRTLPHFQSDTSQKIFHKLGQQEINVMGQAKGMQINSVKQ